MRIYGHPGKAGVYMCSFSHTSCCLCDCFWRLGIRYPQLWMLESWFWQFWILDGALVQLQTTIRINRILALYTFSFDNPLFPPSQSTTSGLPD